MVAAAQPEQPKVPSLSLSLSLSPSHGPLTAPEVETVPTAAADAVEVVEVAPHDGGAAELNSCTPTHVHDREEREERERERERERDGESVSDSQESCIIVYVPQIQCHSERHVAS